MTGRSLPGGFLTFVFTDIEGSTRLLQARPDDYPFLLEVHSKVVRSRMDPAGGIEVNSEGDGFFWVFRSAADAVTAAIDLQQAFAREPVLADAGVRIRIGMTTGEAQLGGRDYVGLPVHHAARVGNAAHGGQILITEATRDAAGNLAGVEFADKGEHLLRDLARPLRLFQVGAHGLERGFPPPRGLEEANADHLPATLTSFIGRDEDVAQLREALAAPGLVTLTGPGGTGKTRLAVETARSSRAQYEAIWFADLQPATEAGEVIAAVATAIDPSSAGGGPPSIDDIASRIGARPCLLLLDNCEQVLDGAASLIEGLIERCRRLTVLATSRELLGLEYESARRTPALAADEAAELFRERTSRVAPDLELAPQADRIVRICERLDGIPLAIELAAARTRHFPLEEIEERLSDRFNLLVGRRSSGTGGRHETLQAVVDWSHDLLSENQRALFRRTGVFAGSFDLAAVGAVAQVEPAVDDAGEVLAQLVDRSLVEHEGRGRYRLLETLRAFAAEKLEDAGEGDLTRTAHARHYTSVAEALEWGPGDLYDVTKPAGFAPDIPNVEAAIEYASERSDPIHRELALRMAAATAHLGGSLGPRSIQAAGMDVSLPGDDRSDLRIRAVLAACAASSPAREAVEAAEALISDEAPALHRAMLLLGKGSQARAAGRLEDALEFFDQSAAAAAEAGVRSMQVAAQASAGFVVVMQGREDAWAQRFELATELSRGQPMGYWDAAARFWGGMAAGRFLDADRGNPYYNEALVLYRQMGSRNVVQWILEHLSQLNLAAGNVDEARAYAEEGVRHSLDNNLGRGTNLEGMYAVLGLTEEIRGDLAQAIHYFQLALELKPFETQPHGHVVDLCRLASAWSRADEPDVALGYLRRACELITQVKPRELAARQVDPVPWGALYLAAARWAHAAGLHEESALMLGAARAIRPHGWDLPVMKNQRRKFEMSLATALGGEDALESRMVEGEAMDDPFSRAQQLVGSDPESSSVSATT